MIEHPAHKERLSGLGAYTVTTGVHPMSMGVTTRRRPVAATRSLHQQCLTLCCMCHPATVCANT
jgi:hypothetical protein